MRIVTDSSVFLAVALNGPEKVRLIDITNGHDLIAPDVLPYELGNALGSLFRRKRICAADVLKIWDVLMGIPVELKPIEIRSALELARENKIYAYDAYFLECSRHWRCPLLTLDKKLKTTAKKNNIEALEY
ncbi:PIN domain-containing protein [Candidatus Fermentibacteria bacterium]|nr:PIN domain-containing protein [Candidatus Fermentibacteria bacterium]